MALDHWLVITDDDLALIEDGPVSWNQDVVEAWVRDVQEIVEDGLETA